MAIHQFIVNNGDEEGYVELDLIDPPGNTLELKLYHLMRKKMVDDVSLETIDEVVYKISDRIIEKYTTAVKGLISHGN